MALNMNDPYLEAERQPPSLVALGDRLKRAYGVGADNFGIKGNEFHGNGFHRSEAFIEDSPQGPGEDYSTQGSLNQSINRNNNSGFDFTPGAWGTTENRRRMIEITKRLREAARRNDHRLDAYYEFAGTEDGKTVVTFYAQGGAAKTPFDSSHLDHVHGSKYRSRSDWDDNSLADVMLGIGIPQEDDEMPLLIEVKPTGFTSVSLPPEGQGAWPRQAFLNVCNDVGGTNKYALRVWYSMGKAGDWKELPGWGPGGVREITSGEAASADIPDGTRCLTISRQASNGVTYDGNLTVSLDYGPIKNG
jgi:hypothetical protein